MLDQNLYSPEFIGAYATAITALLTAAIALFAALQLRASRKQQFDQALFYFHQYLANTKFGDARWHMREKLSAKPWNAWTAEDRSTANVVAASYDQAAMLLDTGAITKSHKRRFLQSSWGESICDQYEILSAFLNQNQTPQKKGREFFIHFTNLYEEAGRYHPVFRVISGGQTGVDQGALAAAVKTGTPYGGWCPKGGATDRLPDQDGVPDVRDAFPNMRETESDDPAIRTALNVMLGTHTLILHKGAPDFIDGTALTVQICQSMAKPLAIVSLDDPTARQKVLSLVGNAKHRLVLNVAGPRESSTTGIQAETEAFLTKLLPAFKRG